MNLNFKHLVKKIVEMIPHRHCCVCHQSSSELLCQYCLQDACIPLFPAPGYDLLDYSPVYTHLSMPAYEGLWALSKYDGLISKLINQLKFSQKPLLAKVLAKYFIYYNWPRLNLDNNIPDILVPIPLSNWRYAGRQYNQARLLSMELAKGFGIQSVDALFRVRHTRQQSGLDKAARIKNIENAFACLPNLPISLNHLSVALVDDVITTGATINAACGALQKAFPEIRISVWCIAVTMNS